MRLITATVLSGALWLLPAPAISQTAPEAGRVAFSSVVRNVAQAVDTGFVRELTLTPADNPPAPALRHFAVARTRRVPGKIRRERNPQLSSDRLVLIVRDRDGRELSWQIVLNPWLVRLEAPDASGVLSGQTLEMRDQPWTVSVPDFGNSGSVTVYQPRWTDAEFLLDPIGDIPIP